MDIIDWAFWLLTETVKYILIPYRIFGIPISKSRKKYFLIIYFIMGVLLIEYLSLDSLIFRTFWGLIILLFLFNFKIQKKLQLFFIEYISISLIDTLIWVVLLYILKGNIKEVLFGRIADVLGVLVWGGVALAVSNIRLKIKGYFEELSWGFFLLFVGGILSIITIIGSMQTYLMDNTTIQMRKVMVIACIIVSIFIFLIYFLLYRTNQLKKQMEEKNRLSEEYSHFQKKYYEELLSKYDDMKGFRHDFKTHMSVLKTLVKEGKLVELDKYFEQLDHKYIEIKTIHTGNIIVDCILNGILNELQDEKELEINILGKFPTKMKIENSDLCILLSNALNNAKEALEKVSGRKVLEMEIKNYHDRIFLSISNNFEKGQEDFPNTTKRDKFNHGYGTKNMKRVVEKYNGNIEWSFEESMFKVNIFLEV